MVACGFLAARKLLPKLNLGDVVPGLLDYPNLPRSIGAVVSSDKATLRECQEYYSIEDVYNMLEVIAIDAHNRRVMDEYARRKGKQGG